MIWAWLLLLGLRLVCAAGGLAEWLGWCPVRRQGEALVSTHLGDFEGLVECNHRAFLGIRYAQAQRWQLPQAYRYPLQVVNKVQQWGDYCPQLRIDQERHPVMDLFFWLPQGGESEDCLNLNIFTPRTAQGVGKKPVLVFIHGGMFSKGASAMPLYDPHRLVSMEGEVVVVTLNYRLGLFGFLGGPQWRGLEGNGNWALYDMRLALEWIKENIADFGGDPHNLTLMGQSAGAMAAHYLTAWCPHLFHRVILMGGSKDLLPSRTMEAEGVAAKSLQIMLDSFACTEVACLQKIPWRKLQAVAVARGWEFIWAPLHEEGGPWSSWSHGIFRRKNVDLLPMLLTTVKDEGSLFACMQVMKGLKVRESLEEIMANHPHLIHRCLNLYAGAGSNDFDQINAMITDAQFHCPVRRMEESSQSNLYYDQIAQPFSLASAFTSRLMAVDFGTFHGSDVMILFRSIPLVIYPHAREIGNTQQRIMHFVRTGEYPWTRPRGAWLPESVALKCRLIWEEMPAGAIPSGWNANLQPVVASS